MAHVLEVGKQYPGKHTLTTCHKLQLIYILRILSETLAELTGAEGKVWGQKSAQLSSCWVEVTTGVDSLARLTEAGSTRGPDWYC